MGILGPWGLGVGSPLLTAAQQLRPPNPSTAQARLLPDSSKAGAPGPSLPCPVSLWQAEGPELELPLGPVEAGHVQKRGGRWEGVWGPTGCLGSGGSRLGQWAHLI